MSAHKLRAENVSVDPLSDLKNPFLDDEPLAIANPVVEQPKPATPPASPPKPKAKETKPLFSDSPLDIKPKTSEATHFVSSGFPSAQPLFADVGDDDFLKFQPESKKAKDENLFAEEAKPVEAVQQQQPQPTPSSSAVGRKGGKTISLFGTDSSFGETEEHSHEGLMVVSDAAQPDALFGTSKPKPNNTTDVGAALKITDDVEEVHKMLEEVETRQNYLTTPSFGDDRAMSTQATDASGPDELDDDLFAMMENVDTRDAGDANLDVSGYISSQKSSAKTDLFS